MSLIDITERLRHMADTHHAIKDCAAMSEAASTLEAQQAEIAALLQDRARYQWLANAVLACDYGDNERGGLESPDRIGWSIRFTRRNAEPFIFGQSIDAAIDAALNHIQGDGRDA